MKKTDNIISDPSTPQVSGSGAAFDRSIPSGPESLSRSRITNSKYSVRSELIICERYTLVQPKALGKWEGLMFCRREFVRLDIRWGQLHGSE